MFKRLLVGAIIGGAIVGICSNNKKSSQQDAKRAQLIRSYNKSICRQTPYIYQVTPKQTKDSLYYETTQKFARQINFFDEFRALDNKLSRMVRKGYKGITYLINGLEKAHMNPRLVSALKNIRNYRNILCHDKRAWTNVAEPANSVMSDLYLARNWVSQNEADACHLVWRGLNAFRARQQRY